MYFINKLRKRTSEFLGTYVYAESDIILYVERKQLEY